MSSFFLDDQFPMTPETLIIAANKVRKKLRELSVAPRQTTRSIRRTPEGPAAEREGIIRTGKDMSKQRCNRSTSTGTFRLAAPLYLGTYLGESLTGSARSRNARRDRPRTPQVGKLGRGCGETPDHKPTPEPRHRTVLNTTGRGGRGLCFCCLLFFLLCSS